MMEWITQNWQDVVLAITATVTAAAAITALTPTPKDDAIVAKIRKALNVIGLNVLNAKSK